MSYTAGKTKKGKEIKVVFSDNGVLYKVQFASGGELPKELQGEFTSSREAEKAIQRYLAKPRKPKYRYVDPPTTTKVFSDDEDK